MLSCFYLILRTPSLGRILRFRKWVCYHWARRTGHWLLRRICRHYCSRYRRGRCCDQRGSDPSSVRRIHPSYHPSVPTKFTLL